MYMAIAHCVCSALILTKKRIRNHQVNGLFMKTVLMSLNFVVYMGAIIYIIMKSNIDFSDDIKKCAGDLNNKVYIQHLSDFRSIEIIVFCANIFSIFVFIIMCKVFVTLKTSFAMRSPEVY